MNNYEQFLHDAASVGWEVYRDPDGAELHHHSPLGTEIFAYVHEYDYNADCLRAANNFDADEHAITLWNTARSGSGHSPSDDLSELLTDAKAIDDLYWELYELAGGDNYEA